MAISDASLASQSLLETRGIHCPYPHRANASCLTRHLDSEGNLNGLGSCIADIDWKISPYFFRTSFLVRHPLIIAIITTFSVTFRDGYATSTTAPISIKVKYTPLPSGTQSRIIIKRIVHPPFIKSKHLPPRRQQPQRHKQGDSPRKLQRPNNGTTSPVGSVYRTGLFHRIAVEWDGPPARPMGSAWMYRPVVGS